MLKIRAESQNRFISSSSFLFAFHWVLELLPHQTPVTLMPLLNALMSVQHHAIYDYPAKYDTDRIRTSGNCVIRL